MCLQISLSTFIKTCLHLQPFTKVLSFHVRLSHVLHYGAKWNSVYETSKHGDMANVLRESHCSTCMGNIIQRYFMDNRSFTQFLLIFTIRLIALLLLVSTFLRVAINIGTKYKKNYYCIGALLFPLFDNSQLFSGAIN